MKLFVKNENFGRKIKFWGQKYHFFGQHRNYGQKWKLWSKIVILVKNPKIFNT